MGTILFLDMRARGCLAEAFLDGIPLGLVGGDLPENEKPGAPVPFSARESKPVEHVVVPGDNRLELVLRPPPSFAPQPEDDVASWMEGAWAWARLVHFDEGSGFADSESNGRIICEVALPDPVALPRLTRAASHVDLGATRLRPSWQNAAVLQLSPTLLDQAEATYRKLAEVLARGDADAFVAMCSAYLDDFARAYPSMPRAELAEGHAQFARDTGRGGRLEIADRDEWVVRLTGGGRLFDARLDDGRSILNLVQADGLEIDFPLQLGWLARDELLLFR